MNIGMNNPIFELVSGMDIHARVFAEDERSLMIRVTFFSSRLAYQLRGFVWIVTHASVKGVMLSVQKWNDVCFSRG